MHTWKVVYYPKELNAGIRGVALVEANTEAEASYAFKQQNQGKFSTIESIKKITGGNSMSSYGNYETWKVVYVPKEMNGGMRGVALIEAPSRSEASFSFQQQYAGQYHTIERIEKLIK